MSTCSRNLPGHQVPILHPLQVQGAPRQPEMDLAVVTMTSFVRVAHRRRSVNRQIHVFDGLPST